MINNSIAQNNLMKLNILPNGVQKNNMTNFQKEFGEIVVRMLKRIEREIPDTGYFSDFSENIGRDKFLGLYAKDVTLFIEKDTSREGRAFLGVSVLHPNMTVEAPHYLINGDRKTLLKKLGEEEFLQQIEEIVYSLDKELEAKR